MSECFEVNRFSQHKVKKSRGVLSVCRYTDDELPIDTTERRFESSEYLSTLDAIHHGHRHLHQHYVVLMKHMKIMTT